MQAEKLIEQLQHQTYIALKASPVHGIGVFAICPIPKGCRTIFSKGMGVPGVSLKSLRQV